MLLVPFKRGRFTIFVSTIIIFLVYHMCAMLKHFLKTIDLTVKWVKIEDFLKRGINALKATYGLENGPLM